MVVPAFGFSTGDFIAGVHLIAKIIQALQDSSGAAVECQGLCQDLQILQALFEQLQETPPSTVSLNYYNAVRGLALTVRPQLQVFLGKLEKYRNAFANSGTSLIPKLGSAPRKLQWTLKMQDEVAEIRSIVTMKVTTTSLSLTLLVGKLVHDGLKEQSVVYDKLHDALDKQGDLLSTKLDKTTTEPCQSYQETIAKTTGRQTELIISTSKAVELQVSHVALSVRSLLERFATFSDDVLKYLRRLHEANIEIYRLLSRVPWILSRYVDGTILGAVHLTDSSKCGLQYLPIEETKQKLSRKVLRADDTSPNILNMFASGGNPGEARGSEVEADERPSATIGFARKNRAFQQKFDFKTWEDKLDEGRRKDEKELHVFGKVHISEPKDLEVAVQSTWASNEYDRKGEVVACDRLAPRRVRRGVSTLEMSAMLNRFYLISILCILFD
ncbi:hypothetical protein FQN54_004447 [Arachnomyces sp. PD_36]|nr:hypothetical protein FQN54_004447 [Arachnomyces sp. PD_36]